MTFQTSLFKEAGGAPNVEIASLDTLDQLVGAMRLKGVTRLYAKTLAANDNSKNQVYFGASFNVLPVRGEMEATKTKHGINFHAGLDFYWLGEQGQVANAPHAKLILYPEYPEVRFSGFLRGCQAAPSALLNQKARIPGRVLFLGVTPDRQVIGWVAKPDSPMAQALEDLEAAESESVFKVVPLGNRSATSSHRDFFIEKLLKIYGSGDSWHGGRRLNSKGEVVFPYNARNAGGYTLEALFGIRPNGSPDPDVADIELKVMSKGGRITLMTPEPTGGSYVDNFVGFMQTYGSERATEDRLDFTGTHRVGEIHPKTNLTLSLFGYDPKLGEHGSITDVDGRIQLANADGAIAASWSFGKVLEHWANKHRYAAYVDYKHRPSGGLADKEYTYGPQVDFGAGGHPLSLLGALANGMVYYDPGLKVKKPGKTGQRIKKRSQFRTTRKHLVHLYESYELLDLSAPGAGLSRL